VRIGSCAGRTRSSRRRRLSSRGSSTRDRRDIRFHRRSPGTVRGRADLPRAVRARRHDRPEHLLGRGKGRHRPVRSATSSSRRTSDGCGRRTCSSMGPPRSRPSSTAKASGSLGARSNGSCATWASPAPGEAGPGPRRPTAATPSTGPPTWSTAALRRQHPTGFRAAPTRTPTACSASTSQGTDLARHSRGDLDAVALALNTRPRKTLGWKTPAEAFDELLRSA
jgi:hypothetical protein